MKAAPSLKKTSVTKSSVTFIGNVLGANNPAYNAPKNNDLAQRYIYFSYCFLKKNKKIIGFVIFSVILHWKRLRSLS